MKSLLKRLSNRLAVSQIRASRLRQFAVRGERLERRDLLAAFNLSNYELNIYTSLANPFSNDDEFSGAAYSQATNTFFVVDDAGQGDIYQYNLDGTPSTANSAEIDLENFPMLEGIYHLGGTSFALLQEDPRELSFVTLPPPMNQLDKNDLPPSATIELDDPILNNAEDNDGPEGVAFDSVDNEYYIVKEKLPIELFRLNGNQLTQINVPGLSGSFQDDLSDAFFYNKTVGGNIEDHLLLVSDQGQSIIDVKIDDATDSGTIEPASLTNLPQRKFEGLTFDPTSFYMILVADRDDNIPVRGFAQFRNFTVLTAEAPDLLSTSDTGVSTSDNITADTTPTFSGTVTHTSTSTNIGGAWVWLYVDGAQVGSPVETDANGNYQISTAVFDGTHTFQVQVGENSTSPAANRSPLSAPLLVTIDTTPPVVDAVALGNDTPGIVHGADNIEAVANGADQLFPVEVGGGVTFIEIMFDEPIAAQQSDLTIVEAISGNGVNVTGLSTQSVPGGFVGRWTFDNVRTGQLEFTLDGTSGIAVTNLAGTKLDGFWTNPDSFGDTEGNSAFPSGRGSITGDNFVFRTTVLEGDATRDGIVSRDDLVVVNGAYHLTTPVVQWTGGDLTGDGDVKLLDVAAVSNSYGIDLTTWGVQQIQGGGGQQQQAQQGGGKTLSSGGGKTASGNSSGGQQQSSSSTPGRIFFTTSNDPDNDGGLYDGTTPDIQLSGPGDTTTLYVWISLGSFTNMEAFGFDILADTTGVLKATASEHVNSEIVYANFGISAGPRYSNDEMRQLTLNESGDGQAELATDGLVVGSFNNFKSLNTSLDGTDQLGTTDTGYDITNGAFLVQSITLEALPGTAGTVDRSEVRRRRRHVHHGRHGRRTIHLHGRRIDIGLQLQHRRN